MDVGCPQDHVPLLGILLLRGVVAPGWKAPGRSIMQCRYFCPPWKSEIAEDKALDLSVFQPCGDGHRWKACRRGTYCAGKPRGAVLQGDALI